MVPGLLHCVIPTHGPPRLLRRTLESIALARRPDGFGQVWVIENGSDAGARAVCDRVGGGLPVEYRHIDAAGRSRALQFAVETLQGGLVVFFDDDVRVDENIFQAYAAAGTRHGEAGVYGGPLLIDYEQSPPPSWLLDHLPASAKGWEPENPDSPIGPGSHFLGANFGAYAQKILEVGGFNPALGTGTAGDPVGEEVDLQDRLLAAGGRGVYVPEAKVWHYVPADRCSPSWALRRLERTWLTAQLVDPQISQGPLLWGVPRWMWRRWLSLGFKALWANLTWDAQRRFEIKKVFYQWRGTMRGYKIGHLQARSDPVKTKPDTHTHSG